MECGKLRGVDNNASNDAGGESVRPVPLARWEFLPVAVAMAAAFGLGIANLGEPSLWHDELVHVYVGKSIAETGQAQLPSGTPYYSGTVMNVILAAVIRLWGLSETVVRSPSVVLATVNVLLTFLIVRALLGRPTAIVATFAMALSPWTVAWSREARFYTLQQGLYLAVIGSFWLLTVRQKASTAAAWGVAALTAYALAILTAFHSILFLGPIGVYAAAMAAVNKNLKSRWVVLCCLLAVVGGLTLISYMGLMNPLDRETVLDRGGLGGEMPDAAREVRSYYTLWLRLNLSTGFFLLALLGSFLMLIREGRKGLYTALAFWVPILVLTFLIGYRRPRFMFFAFPFYVAAFSYATVFLAQWLRKTKTTWLSRCAAVLVILFASRLAWSILRLTGDSLDVAAGADTTLARRHPQWRKPCLYVRDHLNGAAVLTTTYLPALYYVGRVDNWYPSRYLWWEVDESGMDDLKELDDLKAFVAEHPTGYFIAEAWRFKRNPGMAPELRDVAEEIAWVEEHMRRVEEASTVDVTLYAWGQ